MTFSVSWWAATNNPRMPLSCGCEVDLIQNGSLEQAFHHLIHFTNSWYLKCQSDVLHVLEKHQHSNKQDVAGLPDLWPVAVPRFNMIVRWIAELKLKQIQGFTLSEGTQRISRSSSEDVADFTWCHGEQRGKMSNSWYQRRKKSLLVRKVRLNLYKVRLFWSLLFCCLSAAWTLFPRPLHLQVIVCSLLNAASQGPGLIPGAPPPSFPNPPPPAPSLSPHPNITASHRLDWWPGRLPPTGGWMKTPFKSPAAPRPRADGGESASTSAPSVSHFFSCSLLNVLNETTQTY